MPAKYRPRRGHSRCTKRSDPPARSRADALGTPRFTPDDEASLFAAYAPTFVIDERSDDDRIGTPALSANGDPYVAPDEPIVFTRLAYARVGQRVLPQLVYTAWFPARTAQSRTICSQGRSMASYGA